MATTLRFMLGDVALQMSLNFLGLIINVVVL